MKKNMLGAFTLALLVLMGTGVAFGHWQDWVYVDGYVNTGWIDVVPSYEGSEFDPINYKPYTDGKGVAWDDVYVEESTLYINLYNVYPGICWHGMFNIENLGTVPAGFVGITAMNSDPELKLVQTGPWVFDVYYDDGTAWVGPIAELAINQCAPNGLDTSPAVAQNGYSTLCQIDPGYPVYFCVSICFENPLPQETDFQFDLTLEFWNWNEVQCM